MIYQAYVGVITFLIFSVQKGHGINCYSCSSRNNEACEDLTGLTPVHCDKRTLRETQINAEGINKSYYDVFEVDHVDAGKIDLVCLKVVIKDGNEDVILRGCQLAEQPSLDICNKLEKSNTMYVRNVFCSKCSNIDGCNSSPITFNINVVLGFVCIVICTVFSDL